MKTPDQSLIAKITEFLEYKADDGVFLWKRSPSHRVTDGMIAGHTNSRGYTHLKLFGMQIPAHRAAWAVTYGKWPKNQIDHIDGNKSNNKISNLRDIGAKSNTQNQIRSKSSNLSSGLLGVSRNRGKWQAQIKVAGRRKHLGTFDSPVIAHQAYLAAKRLMHEGCTI